VEGPASDHNFHFTGLHRQGHSDLITDGQTFTDSIHDIRFSLSLSSPLADATRNGRALANVDPIFVSVDTDNERFSSKNTKGEWFSLSRQDVEAFKRRKFM
jgi:hypothetical protein